MSKDNNESIKEAPLDKELEDLFGNDPLASKTLELKIHSSIHNRWKYWFSNGLNKEERESLLEKYVSPPGLEAPKLNPEIALKLPKHSKARDNYMCKRQQMAGAALASLGFAITSLIEEKESIDKLTLLERLHNTGQLIADMMHNQTKSRAALILAGVDKKTRSLLEETKPQEFLFGNNLTDKIKESRSMDKVANSLKKQTFDNAGSSSSKHLNSYSLLGKRPFPSQAGANPGYQYAANQTRPRLPFRNKQQNQPFNPRAQYQGYSKPRNPQRFK